MRSVENAGGGVSARNLDTRLLRFRNRPTSEDGSSLAAELLSAGRYTEALEVATTALTHSPDDARLHLVEGQAWMREGDLIRAQAALLKAARAAPRDKEPFRWLGEVLLKRGDPSRAVKVLERALEIDPNDRAVKLLHQRAERFSRIADTEVATEVAKKTPAAGVLGDEDEEATTVGRDVAEKIADKMRELEDDDSADTRVDDRPELPDFSEDDEEAPTRVAEAFPGVVRAGGEPSAVRVPKRTMMGLGGGGNAKPAAPPPSGPSAAAPPPPPPPAPPAPKRTMLGLGAQKQAPAAPPAAPPPPVPAAAAAPPRPPAPRPSVNHAFGSDPFAASGAFDDLTTDRREVPAPPLEHARVTIENEPRRPSASSIPPPLPPLREARGDDGLSFTPPVKEPESYGGSPERPLPRSPGGFEPPPGPVYDEDEESTAREIPDVRGGDRVGETEDVDAVLRMLEREGIFEQPSGEAARWASKKESRPARTRIGRVLAVAWVLAIALAVGGWFGWQEWIKHRHAEARRMVDEAAAKGLEGNHAALVDAERTLRIARDLNPHDKEGPAVMLFVHAQRALEDGAFEAGYLRPTLNRGERMDVSEARVNAARAVLAAAEGDMDAARQSIEDALEAGAEDPAVLYMAGRVEQRLGEEDALEHLEQAVDQAPELAGAAIALAEARLDEGRREEAIQLLDGVLERYADHLRATLWKEFVTADETDPEEGLARVAQLEERLEMGAPTDRVLTELTRARLLRRKGDTAQAAEAVDRAGAAGATEPRLLALVATEAKAVGRLALAQASATSAVAGAPSNQDFRKLLAQIMIDRRDGVRALRTLSSSSMEDPEVLRMSAEAALLVGTADALRAAAEALAGYVAQNEEPSVEMRALRIRTAVMLGEARAVLNDAKQLAQDAPGDPLAARALGEAALSAGDASAATDALGRLVQAAPEDADAHYLLGRARRLSGDAEGAEESFRRALELLPEHTEARLALGRLLLDQGKYGEADELYQELARQSGIASGAATALLGRLGRVEALLGLGRVDDAAVQMESVQAQDRETTLARIAAAQLALAKNRPGDAVTQLRPLATREDPPPQADVIALFGDALFAAGEIEAANDEYERALEIDRGLPEALMGKAKVAVRAENTRDAGDYLDRVESSLRARIRPPRMLATAHLLRGRAALQAGRNRRDAARAALRQAVEIDGAPPEAWFWLGEALSGENAPESRAAYEKYLELEPDGPYASRARRAVR